MQPDKKAEIQVNQIAIYFNQETGDCYEDEVLEVYQTKPGKRKLLKSLCGTSRSIAPIRSVTNMATLVFKRYYFIRQVRITQINRSALPTSDKSRLIMVELGMVSLLLMLPFRKNETMKEQIRSQGVFMQHLS